MADLSGPRVSRDTRRLLATVLLSLAALWIFARIRFPERPATPNPVPPVLTQIAPRAGFDDLVQAVSDLEPVVAPAFVVISAERRNAGGGPRPQPVASLRFQPEAALALTDGFASAPGAGLGLSARDRATGLTIVRTPKSAPPTLRTWTPQHLDYPRYVFVTEVLEDQVVLRPVFLGGLGTGFASGWSGEVWRVPTSAYLPKGAFVFTTAGALAGVVAGTPDAPVIVPAATVLSAAERLLASPPGPPGWLGVEVRGLGSRIGDALGVSSGVVVTWVDPRGPAAGRLGPTDLVQSLGDEIVIGPADWEVGVARLAAGQEIAVGVRRGGGTEQVKLTAAAPPVAAVSPKLGLTMRRRSGIGAEVLRVEDGSVAMRAGIRPGDVLTLAGGVAAPTPTDVNEAFAGAGEGAVLVALTRGAEHLVLAVGKR